MISEEKDRDAAVHPEVGRAPIIPLGGPATLELAPGTRFELLQLEGNAPVYEIASVGAVELRTGGCERGSTPLRLDRESIRLRLAPQDRIAVIAADIPLAINVSPAQPPRLFVDRIFAGLRNGRTCAPRSPVPGSVLQMLLAVADLAEDDALPSDPPRVTFRYAEAGVSGEGAVDGEAERIELEASFADPALFEAAGVERGDRRVIDLRIPAHARPGFGRLIVDWGDDLYLDGVELEIADPGAARRREALARRAAARARRILGVEPAVIGGYSPLPAGTELCEALTGQHIYSIRDDDPFLFFAFDPSSRFEQRRTVWLLALPAAKRFETFVRPVWPQVVIPENDDAGDGITCRGSRYGLDFGSPANQRNQFFGGPGVLDERPVAPPSKRTPVRAPVSPLAGRPLLGGTARNCVRVTKVAILVQLDDDDGSRDRRGRPVPNFDDVMRRERSLVQALGFDRIEELRPDDFVTSYTSIGRPRFRRPTRGNPRSLQPLLERIDAVVGGIRDCCTELAIFVNAHQSRAGYLRYRNRDVRWRNRPERTSDIEESISAAILSRLVAEQIQRSTAEAKLPCQPAAELIFHSCFSGRFGNSDFDRANRAGLGITASSGGRQTTKGRRNGGAATPDEYFFLDALEECATASPGRTIGEIFDCVRQRTNARSGGTQRPVRKPPRR